MQATNVLRVLCVFGSASLVWAASACSGKVVFDQSSGGSGGTGAVQGGTQATTTGSGKGSVTATGNTVGTGVVGTSVVATSSGSVSNQAASSGSGFPPSSVFCNGMACMQSEVCCFNPNGPGDHCGNSGQCDPGFAELSCNSPADCPNAICCATFDGNTQTYQGIACQTTCNAPDELVVCSQMQPDVCPNGTQCHKSMQLGNGYRVCF